MLIVGNFRIAKLEHVNYSTYNGLMKWRIWIKSGESPAEIYHPSWKLSPHKICHLSWKFSASAENRHLSWNLSPQMKICHLKTNGSKSKQKLKFCYQRKLLIQAYICRAALDQFNDMHIACILHQDMAFQSQMVLYPLFTAKFNGEGGTAQLASFNNQVHTTPLPVLQFLGNCMGPVHWYPSLVYRAQQFTVVVLVDIMVD